MCLPLGIVLHPLSGSIVYNQARGTSSMNVDRIGFSEYISSTDSIWDIHKGLFKQMCLAAM